MMKTKEIYPIRYYAIGHSYLLHGPFVGWQTKGFWGMAASEPEKDYFHRVQQRLQAEMPCSLEAIAENYATYERLCTATATEQTYRESDEYGKILENLERFQPNLITLYIGGGNTIAKDVESLTLFYHTLYSLIADHKPKEAVVICPFSNGRTLFAMDIARQYGFVPVDLTVLHEKGKTRENPYYALAAYPEYDEAVKAGAIEFRTHPSDLGHDRIAQGIVEAAVPLLRNCLKPVEMKIPDKGSAEISEAANGDSVTAARREIDCWEFDTLQDCVDVSMGGFNLRCENSIAQVSSAPGTGAAVYHQSLHLPMKKYSRLAVRMRLDCETPEKGVLLQVTTTEKICERLVYLSAQTMGDIELPLPEEEGTITGFRIEPQMTDCCIYIDRIAFE